MSESKAKTILKEFDDIIQKTDNNIVYRQKLGQWLQKVREFNISEQEINEMSNEKLKSIKEYIETELNYLRNSFVSLQRDSGETFDKGVNLGEQSAYDHILDKLKEV